MDPSIWGVRSKINTRLILWMNTIIFESRTGKLSCTAEEVFDFVTDIRNFEQFIPAATISNWQAEKESCSFSVSMLGTVSFRLAEKENV